MWTPRADEVRGCADACTCEHHLKDLWNVFSSCNFYIIIYIQLTLRFDIITFVFASIYVKYRRYIISLSLISFFKKTTNVTCIIPGRNCVTYLNHVACIGANKIIFKACNSTCCFVTLKWHNYGSIVDVQLIIDGGLQQTCVWVEPATHCRLAGKLLHMKTSPYWDRNPCLEELQVPDSDR